ncbi:unnamed protein product [marine sediment metagenome]|uniref:Uncharacterized protein n=1 Tax=marine sediment metagenome TaxID=412755 RepID=X1UXH5_9ZZZZ
MTTELDELIQYWKNTLFRHSFLMPPSVQYLVGLTIEHLKELKTLKEA